MLLQHTLYVFSTLRKRKRRKRKAVKLLSLHYRGVPEGDEASPVVSFLIGGACSSLWGTTGSNCTFTDNNNSNSGNMSNNMSNNKQKLHLTLIITIRRKPHQIHRTPAPHAPLTSPLHLTSSPLLHVSLHRLHLLSFRHKTQKI